MKPMKPMKNFTNFTVNVGKPRNSKGYLTTIDMSCENDLAVLSDIRSILREENKKGRKDGKVGHLYLRKAKPINGSLKWDKNRNLICSEENVEFKDVYVYYY